MQIPENLHMRGIPEWLTVLLIVAEKVIKKQIHNCAIRSGIAISLSGISAQFYRNMQTVKSQVLETNYRNAF